MNRPKTTGKALPPRMLQRSRTLASGKVWVGYYYNGRGPDGARQEIPLGTDLLEAKRKWAKWLGQQSYAARTAIYRGGPGGEVVA